MKANKTAILILTWLSMLTTACSSISSMEDKLVGEWQSSKPEFVRLRIAKAGTDNEGFHDGYSSTRNGQSSTKNWRIDNDSKGPVLVLQGKGYWDDFARRTGNSGGAESPHRIIELTSDRFVVDWNDSRFPNFGTDIQEFQKVK